MAMTIHYSSQVLVLLCFYNFSFLKALDGGFSVEIVHRDSLRSPLYRPTETQFQRVTNALHRSINRAKHFNTNSDTLESIVTHIPGEYLMSYSVGTPPFQVFGVVDTGSDLIWLQCQPCESCYNQTTPIFDPSKSNTYKTLPCSSDTCQYLPTGNCSSENDTCKYNANYGDGSFSHGDLSVETLTLGSTDGSSVQFPNTIIGCGHNNSGTFRPEFSGIVALGGGDLSLISRLSSSIHGKFSYCLIPMLSQNNNSTSKLSFGDAATVSGLGTVSTPLTRKRVFYFLTLESFSVGDNRIEFGGSSATSEEGNIIIDSGTTLTQLPQDVYSNLESAVANAIKMERVQIPSNFFSLCYKTESNGGDNIPVVTAHFRGADVKLNPISTFIEVDEGIICFAFRPNQVAIFGNLAQQNLLVGYDLIQNTVSFKPTDCTKE